MIEPNFNQPSACYPPADFQAYWATTLTPAQHTAIENHIGACLACLNQLIAGAPNPGWRPLFHGLYRQLHTLHQAQLAATRCSSWEDNRFLRFWFELMLLPERQQFQHHLNNCPDCHVRFLTALKIANHLQDAQDQRFRFLTRQIRDLTLTQTNYLTLLNTIKISFDKLRHQSRTASETAEHTNQQVALFQRKLTQLQQLINRQQFHIEQQQQQLAAQLVRQDQLATSLENLINHQVKLLLKSLPSTGISNIKSAATKGLQSDHPTRPDLTNLGPDISLPAKTDNTLSQEPTPMTTIAFNGEFANDYCPDPVSALPLTPTRSHTFLKIAAAVLLGALILTPLAYYRLPPGDHNSNNAAIVDSPDITLEDGQTTPLTETTITEIEKLVKELQLEKAQSLLNSTIKQAYLSNNNLAKAKLLYLQGRVFSEKGDLRAAIAVLKQAIGTAQSLNQPTLLLGPTSLLANLYHFTDKNAEAAEQAQQALSLARSTAQPLHQAFSLQILGLSQFFAAQSSNVNVEKLLEESIAIAQKHQGSDYVIQGYTYLGVVKTERKQFKEAKQYFKLALEKAQTGSKDRHSSYLQAGIKGYFARCEALSNNPQQAINLYIEAIALANQAGVQQYLALSQFHQGLSDCHKMLGDSEQAAKALIKAEVFEEEAYKRCEVYNTALSFALSRKPVKTCE